MKGAIGLLRKDLEALSQEAIFKVFNAETRTVADIIYEVCLVNDHLGMCLRGEEPFEWPETGFIRAPEGLDSKEKLQAHFEGSCQTFLSTLQGMSSQQLAEIIEIDGSQVTRYSRFRFAASHMWYHSGQLNFVQTLFGDTAFHWAE